VHKARLTIANWPTNLASAIDLSAFHALYYDGCQLRSCLCNHPSDAAHLCLVVDEDHVLVCVLVRAVDDGLGVVYFL
jgi:hypothetical protein